MYKYLQVRNCETSAASLVSCGYSVGRRVNIHIRETVYGIRYTSRHAHCNLALTVAWLTMAMSGEYFAAMLKTLRVTAMLCVPGDCDIRENIVCFQSAGVLVHV